MALDRNEKTEQDCLDLTYEGLKRGYDETMEKGRIRLDLTYEGLKHTFSFSLFHSIYDSLDLTYEGLKLGPKLENLGQFVCVWILPMRD